MTPDVLPALASDEDIAWLRRWATDMRNDSWSGACAERVLARLDAAERQVKALRDDLTFIGDKAAFALKTPYEDDIGVLAAILDCARAALEAKSHD